MRFTLHIYYHVMYLLLYNFTILHMDSVLTESVCNRLFMLRYESA
jgi:hypothetical protein